MSETLHRMKLDIWGGDPVTLETLMERYRVAVQFRGGNNFEVMWGEYEDDPDFQDGGVLVEDYIHYTSDTTELAGLLLQKMSIKMG